MKGLNMKTERATNWFPYLYAIMVLIVIQFLAMLWLVGSIETELGYLRAAITNLRTPRRNEVVKVTFGLNQIGGEYNPNDREDRLFTVFGGNLYEMRRVR